jgi:hypothetical protein
MKTAFLLCLSVATAVAGATFFKWVFYQAAQADWLGSSYRADELGTVHYYYTFGYCLVFALAWFFRWPVAPRQQLVATGIALVGGTLPLLSSCFNYYLHSKWLVSEILYLEKWALASLLLAHGITLALVNGLFLLANASRPLQGRVVPA